MSRRLVLLDRDGTVTIERSYVTGPADLALLPGAAAAVRRLRALGLRVALVSNQSAVGRGLMTLEALERVHARLHELLGAEGAALDGVYACPHGPEDGCACRKPLPGLLEQAARELDGDLGRSFVVGDNLRDLEAGRAVGAATVLVLTGHGASVRERASPDHVAEDLAAAADWIAQRI